MMFVQPLCAASPNPTTGLFDFSVSVESLGAVSREATKLTDEWNLKLSPQLKRALPWAIAPESSGGVTLPVVMAPLDGHKVNVAVIALRRKVNERIQLGGTSLAEIDDCVENKLAQAQGSRLQQEVNVIIQRQLALLGQSDELEDEAERLGTELKQANNTLRAAQRSVKRPGGKRSEQSDSLQRSAQMTALQNRYKQMISIALPERRNTLSRQLAASARDLDAAEDRFEALIARIESECVESLRRQARADAAERRARFSATLKKLREERARRAGVATLLERATMVGDRLRALDYEEFLYLVEQQMATVDADDISQ